MRSVTECVRPRTRICWWTSLAWSIDLHCLRRSVAVAVGVLHCLSIDLILVVKGFGLSEIL